MSFKITFIGAGSVGFTRNLLRDILSVPEFQDIQISLTDINSKNLDMVYQLCQRDIESNGMKIQIQATTDRRKALEGARYIFCTVRVGGLEAFAHDVNIPLQYGIDQCVGDTLCAGGIFYAQRGIPALLDFCKDIRELAEPNALLLNYANPMAMMTRAVIEQGGVNILGLCHGVQHGHNQIAESIKTYINKGKSKEDPGYDDFHKSEVKYICAGINHQTWYLKINFRGEDWTSRLYDAFMTHPEYSHSEKVRLDMLKRFGYYSTESNGHLSEYLAWYRKRPEEIPGWIDTGCWINGETGGYLRICTEGRNWFESDFPNWMAEAPQKFTPSERGEEHGSYIIEALETGRIYRGHFNLRNNHCISNLPQDAVIEAPGYIDKTGIHIPPIGALPTGCAAVCSQSVFVQKLAVEAALSSDIKLLRQAMLLDPLTGAVCTPAEIDQLTDDMLIALGPWMPQWQDEVKKAHERQNEARKKGTRIPVNQGYEGAVRLHVKSVEEMSQASEEEKKRAAHSNKAVKADT
ncbi:MAG: alpha-glucosidase/alpha-galactosidase [Spirochaetales bacterium]|nr:alpha-glucosidase/alpha-galactosidase [Spirochaetales bacterium]